MRQNGDEEILVMHPTNEELHTKELPLLENHNHNKQIDEVENIRFVIQFFIIHTKLGSKYFLVKTI